MLKIILLGYIERYQSQDGLGGELIEQDLKQKEKLDKNADKITEFLATYEEKWAYEHTVKFTADSGFNSEVSLEFMAQSGSVPTLWIISLENESECTMATVLPCS